MKDRETGRSRGFGFVVSPLSFLSLRDWLSCFNIVFPLNLVDFRRPGPGRGCHHEHERAAA